MNQVADRVQNRSEATDLNLRRVPSQPESVASLPFCACICRPVFHLKPIFRNADSQLFPEHFQMDL